METKGKTLIDALIFLSDSYKYGHWKQYVDGTGTIYSYLESRGGEYDSTVFFGLQYYLIRYLEGVVVTVSRRFCKLYV